MRSAKIVVLLTAFAAARAQQFEAGILGGGGFANGNRTGGASVPVTAGFDPGPALGASFVQNRYALWSGEMRYLFAERDPRLASGGTSATFSGQTHVLQYDLAFHPLPGKGLVQPYLLAGGGIKIYRGTGAEVPYRPLMEYGYLTKTSELKPMMAVGAGLKLRLGRRLGGRIELESQATPFPQKVITPAPGMTTGKWLFDFVPTAGLSWLF